MTHETDQERMARIAAQVAKMEREYRALRCAKACARRRDDDGASIILPTRGSALAATRVCR